MWLLNEYKKINCSNIPFPAQRFQVINAANLSLAWEWRDLIAEDHLFILKIYTSLITFSQRRKQNIGNYWSVFNVIYLRQMLIVDHPNTWDMVLVQIYASLTWRIHACHVPNWPLIQSVLISGRLMFHMVSLFK